MRLRQRAASPTVPALTGFWIWPATYENGSVAPIAHILMTLRMDVRVLSPAPFAPRAAAALDQIPRLLDFNKGKGDCSLVNMPGPPLLTALKLFPEDFQSHLNDGNCPAT